MKVRLLVDKDPKEVKWIVRVNGLAVGDAKTEFMANWIADCVEKALRAVGIYPERSSK